MTVPGKPRFGQVCECDKDGNKYPFTGKRYWLAEIRDTRTGELVSFAGIWGTRREAVEEILGLHLS